MWPGIGCWTNSGPRHRVIGTRQASPLMPSRGSETSAAAPLHAPMRGLSSEMAAAFCTSHPHRRDDEGDRQHDGQREREDDGDVRVHAASPKMSGRNLARGMPVTLSTLARRSVGTSTLPFSHRQTVTGSTPICAATCSRLIPASLRYCSIGFMHQTLHITQDCARCKIAYHAGDGFCDVA